MVPLICPGSIEDQSYENDFVCASRDGVATFVARNATSVPGSVAKCSRRLFHDWEVCICEYEEFW